MLPITAGGAEAADEVVRGQSVAGRAARISEWRRDRSLSASRSVVFRLEIGLY